MKDKRIVKNNEQRQLEPEVGGQNDNGNSDGIQSEVAIHCSSGDMADAVSGFILKKVV